MKGKPLISRGGPSTKVDGPVRSNLHAITNPLHANKVSDEPDRGQGPQSGGRVQRHSSEKRAEKWRSRESERKRGRREVAPPEREATSHGVSRVGRENAAWHGQHARGTGQGEA